MSGVEQYGAAMEEVEEGPYSDVGIQDKIKSALRHLELCWVWFDDVILIQFWAPVMTGGRCFLMTSGQPFALSEDDETLSMYRNCSLDYKFAVDMDVDGQESEEVLGFPARVFRQMFPESTPLLGYYSTEQHPWCKRHLNFRNLKLMALPIFEPSGESCAGVLEVVAASSSSTYIGEVRKALESVNLQCLGGCDHFDYKNRSKGFQQSLDKIIEVFKVVCETGEILLAQTWVPCRHCNVVLCSSFPNKSPRVVFSKIVDTCYATSYDAGCFKIDTDPLPLQEDQGSVGRAYSDRNSSFCTYITQFSLTQYPMVHYANEYKLSACFAICLKSSYTGEDDCILEFFLPKEKIIWPQILDSILKTMKLHLHTFKVASGKPLVELVSFSMAEKPDSVPNGGEMVHMNSSEQPLMVQDDATNNVRSIGMSEALQNVGDMVNMISSDQPLMVQVNDINDVRSISRSAALQNGGDMAQMNLSQDNAINDVRSIGMSEALQNGGDMVQVNSSGRPLMVQKNAINNVRSVGSAEQSNTAGAYLREKGTGKTSKREPQISLKVLEQHFGRNLEDVAKTFNVSRSTLKRRCRELEIWRWPRCKNNSLSTQDSPMATVAQMRPHVTAMQDVRTVNIKVEYKAGKFIKFQLTATAGLIELEEEIAKRLKLEVGHFSIMYQDEDNDSILLACDEDLQNFIKNSIELGNTIIRMFVELNNNN